MKVELQIGDTIAIPEGCKAVINGNEVVVEKEDKEFKDGDIIINRTGGRIAIFKKIEENGNIYDHAFLNSNRELVVYDVPWRSPLENWDFATEEEAQILLDALKKHGLQWNADKKCIEQFRWRAKLRERYYFFDEFLNVKFDRDENFEIDELRWSIGNYFKTRKDAEAALLMVKELLQKR